MPEVRLEVTDTLGRRVVRIEKPLFTIGRRSESDLRVHAERFVRSIQEW